MSAGRRNKAQRGRTSGPKPGSKADRWSRSAEFRAIADRTLAEFNANRWRLPKCGAKTKRTGEPCRMTILASNGRCRFHGGLTPKGDRWHKIRIPEPGEVGGVEKLDRKLIAHEKAQAKRKRRLAAMTPEERERHEAWQASHKPGKAADRHHARQQRDTRKLFDRILAERAGDQGAEEPVEQEVDVFS